MYIQVLKDEFKKEQRKIREKLKQIFFSFVSSFI
jgi:hypothetical protein